MNTSNIENLTSHILATIQTEKVLHPDITVNEVIVALAATQAAIQAFMNYFDNLINNDAKIP